jgi:hypothetical protein
MKYSNVRMEIAEVLFKCWGYFLNMMYSYKRYHECEGKFSKCLRNTILHNLNIRSVCPNVTGPIGQRCIV